MLDPRKKNLTTSENAIVTVIGQGTSIVGEIRSKGAIRIEGNVSGRIQCDDTIMVHEAGRVKADLVAGQIVISGEVEGNVFAHDRLEIQPKARLIGDITAPRVAIAEGVIFEGKCTMKPPGQVKGPEAPANDQPKQAAPVQQAPKQS
jgi:cytoskeletal protein CcmA (bactofilin family)